MVNSGLVNSGALISCGIFLFQALQYIIIPMFVASFEKGSSETDSIIGGPPNPEQDSGENVISVFVSRVIDPENPFKTSVSLYFYGIL